MSHPDFRMPRWIRDGRLLLAETRESGKRLQGRPVAHEGPANNKSYSCENTRWAEKNRFGLEHLLKIYPVICFPVVLRAAPIPE
jgi:hypothetical protein